MREFHLAPNDPRIMNMTLEQRNFCIYNMNQDVAVKNGKTNDAITDTGSTKWQHVPESKFNPVPKTVRGGTKTVLRNIGKKLGMGELQLEHAQYHHELQTAPLRHAYRVNKNETAEHLTYQHLLRKARKMKKRGIDKSGEWNKYFSDKENKQNHYGFKV